MENLFGLLLRHLVRQMIFFVEEVRERARVLPRTTLSFLIDADETDPSRVASGDTTTEESNDKIDARDHSPTASVPSSPPCTLQKTERATAISCTHYSTAIDAQSARPKSVLGA